MAQNDTVDRILHAATVLFAERGFAETSLRTITGTADVNLAAVNYHFGSKKELIQAVFSRFLNPFRRELDQQMDQLEKEGFENGGLDISVLLRCLFSTLFKATAEINDKPQRFMRLINLSYAQSQEHLRHYLTANYGQTCDRFLGMMKKAMPELDAVESYWRLYFMLGAAVFTLSSYDSIRAILNADYSEDTSIEDVVEMMVPSVSALLKMTKD